MDDIIKTCTFCNNPAATFDSWANPCCDSCFSRDNYGIMAGTNVKQSAPWWIGMFGNQEFAPDINDLFMEVFKLEAKYKGIKW